MDFEIVGGYPANKNQCRTCPDRPGSNFVYVGVIGIYGELLHDESPHQCHEQTGYCCWSHARAITEQTCRRPV